MTTIVSATERGMTDPGILESVLKRDRLVVIVSLLAITVLAWAYLFDMALDMSAMSMAMVKPWSATDFWLMFAMWAIMMFGMMVPSAAPMILLFATVSRKQRARDRTFAPTGAFALGYVAVWVAFSAAATVLQWGFEQAALVSPMMVSTSPILGGALLIGAGVYQWTTLKQACLKHCRSPLQFIMQGWRKGTGGAFRMGLEHGAFCVGCCWILMGLLFFGGVMNLLWIAGITAFVLVEKLAPFGRLTGRVTGVLLMVAGTYVVAQG